MLAMARVEANGVELEYDEFGDAEAPALVLVMGLATQMIAWDEEFCERLAAAGPFRVVRFDNRDIGLSTEFAEKGVPDVMKVLSGEEPPPYTLDDMADDAVGLLDALGIRRAHFVGASMGGFIVQLVAIRHPERVLSLTSIMSGPAGVRDNAPATPEAMNALMKQPPRDREGLIEHGVWVSRTIGGPAYFDEAEVRRRRARAVDRSVRIEGTARQFAAIAAAPDRTEQLRKLDVPALVVHGEADPLVPIENGRRTAAAIPGARLLTFEKMSHDLPRPLWPEIVAAIAELAKQAAAGRSPD